MTAQLHLSGLGPLTAAIRRPLEQIAQPCTCDRPDCRTVGEHIWRATADARRGIPAAALEPSRSTDPALPLPPPLEAVDHAHRDYLHLLGAIVAHCYALQDLVAAWRHDRQVDVPPTTEDVWCRHHLDTIQACEPRYRGDLCRYCYDFELGTRGRSTKGLLPPAEILAARHRGEKVTAKMVDDAIRAARAASRKRKRRKARS